MGKESACSAGNLGSVPGEGHGYTLQYSCLENPVDRRAYSPYSCKQLDMAEAAERTQHSLVQSSLHTCRQGRWLRGLAICAATRRCGAWRSVPLPGAAGPGDLCRYQGLRGLAICAATRRCPRLDAGHHTPQTTFQRSSLRPVN